jgi:hypothetical protein
LIGRSEIDPFLVDSEVVQLSEERTVCARGEKNFLDSCTERYRIDDFSRERESHYGFRLPNKALDPFGA